MMFGLNDTADNSNVTTNDAKMVITSAGNVGIGTTTPESKLDVNGAVTIRGTNFFFYVSTTNWAGTWADYAGVYHGINSNGTIRTVTNLWGF
jgi:hypothetical protein